MGKAAVPFIEKGQLVPDEVVIGIIKERLADADCAGGFILDGFPRTLPQAEALDAMGVAIDMAINLDVPDETIISRMGGRRVCDKCGASYHVEFVPSKDGVHCDHCQTPLTCRQDDLPEVVKNRLDIYHAQSEPLIAYYEKQGKLKTVVGQRELADTTKLIFEAVESGFGR
jgi:adenylate kinase